MAAVPPHSESAKVRNSSVHLMVAQLGFKVKDGTVRSREKMKVIVQRSKVKGLERSHLNRVEQAIKHSVSHCFSSNVTFSLVPIVPKDVFRETLTFSQGFSWYARWESSFPLKIQHEKQPRNDGIRLFS